MRSSTTAVRPRLTIVVGTAIAALAMIATIAPPALADDRPPAVTTVAEGFAGPLGLAVDRHGTVFVGEAFAGLLTSVDRHGARTTVVDIAPHEVAGVHAGRRGVLAWVQTIYEEPTEPGGEPGPAVEASLMVRGRDGRPREIASLLDHENTRNPDGDATYGFEDLDPACAASLPDFLPESYTGIVETHPYAVTRTRGGWAVADAAANAILHVSRSGRVRTVAVLPPVRQEVTAEAAAQFGLPDCVVGAHYLGEPVPTDVEIKRPGHYYVTTLPGAPEAPGAGALWVVDAATGRMRMVATGLSGAVDLAVDRGGTVYVAELFADRISAIDRRGRVSPYVELASPGAVEFRPGGRGPLYATTGVFGPGAVVAIR